MLGGLIKIIPYVLWLLVLINGHFKNLAWNGGPMHVQCEHGLDAWIKCGQHTTENVIATKALVYQDDVYVITPRMKTGIIATLWLIVQEKNGVQLQPYPELRTHKLGDCSAIQNAVDFYLDHHVQHLLMECVRNKDERDSLLSELDLNRLDLCLIQTILARPKSEDAMKLCRLALVVQQ